MNIILAPTPYGLIPYLINLLPMLLCIIVIVVTFALCVIRYKYRPGIVILSPTHAIALSLHASITMLAYALLQYRWIIDQFEGDMIVEVLWAVVESLFLLNIIWSILYMSYSILKYKNTEIDIYDKSN